MIFFLWQLISCQTLKFRPSFPIQDVNFLSKFNSQVMWNLLFEPLIWNFKSDWKFLIWFFFLWLLISYQTSKLRPKINVWKKNQISDRKIKSCWIDWIWNSLLDLTWFIFAVFDVKSFWLLIFMWQKKRALVLAWWVFCRLSLKSTWKNVIVWLNLGPLSLSHENQQSKWFYIKESKNKSCKVQQ